MNRIILPCLMLILITYSCGNASQKNPNQEQEMPSASGLNANNENIYAVLVAKNDSLVSEQYFNGRSQDSLCDVQSLTKGIISILIGIAVDREYIDSIDEPIAPYFPEIYEGLKDERKKAITIRHLLNQTSGLSWKGYLEHEDWLNSNDPISYVLEKELDHLPGTAYNYNSGATHLLSAIIAKTSGKSTLAFADEFLFTDLNINDLDWQIRNDGNYDGSGLGLKMKPIDLMKLGQLLHKRGKWDGQVVVSEKWTERLFDEKEKLSTDWGIRGSKHGLCWYQAQLDGKTINYGMGYGGQFIFLLEEMDLIIVTTHNHDVQNGIDQQIGFISRALPRLISTYGS